MTERKIQSDQIFTFADWQVDPAAGRLQSATADCRLEPKVMELLLCLSAAAPQLVSREQICQQLWPNQIVGDDALARCVLKLRKALNDDARQPQYLETVPKRGYRLLHPVVPQAATSALPRQWSWRRLMPVAAFVLVGLALLVVVISGQLNPNPAPGRGDDDSIQPLLERAHDHYYQFTLSGNESALALYERVITLAPDSGAAKAGLANTLVQRLIRWPADQPPVPPAARNLTAVLAEQRLGSDWARSVLTRAQALAREAVDLAPDDPQTHKALGLVMALQGELMQAAAHYQDALDRDPDTWEAWLNLGDIRQIEGDITGAISAFSEAYAVMQRHYSDDAQRIAPWQGDLGVLIADLHQRNGDLEQAQAWYQRVLHYAPLHVEATVGLAGVHRRQGRTAASAALCENLVLRIGPLKECQPFLPLKSIPADSGSGAGNVEN
ncbi:MAG: hypothetical protein Tsb002_31680 [Wenzhouxiangellaceae bacterium]